MAVVLAAEVTSLSSVGMEAEMVVEVVVVVAVVVAAGATLVVLLGGWDPMSPSTELGDVVDVDGDVDMGGVLCSGSSLGG